MSRFINPVPQFWLDNGTVASSGLVEFYENRDYSTKKDTHADSGLLVKNTNPVKLDGQGRMPPCFGQGLYSVKLYAYDNSAIDKKGALQWTRDDVDMSVGGAGAFDDWNPAVTYALGDTAKDNGKYYTLYGASTSKGQRPSSTLSAWEEIAFLTIYNSNKTYLEDDIVIDSGFIYRSLENENNDYPPSPKWANLTFNDSVAGNFSVGGNFSVTGTFSAGGVATGVTPPLGDNSTKYATTAFVRSELARQTQTVSLTSPFAGGSIKFSRVGNVVVASVVGLAHLSSISVSINSGFIPLEYRPSNDQNFSNINIIPPTNARISKFTFEADGGFRIAYEVIGGGTASTTGADDSSFCWVI